MNVGRRRRICESAAPSGGEVEIDAILGHTGPRYGKVDMRVKRALIN